MQIKHEFINILLVNCTAKRTLAEVIKPGTTLSADITMKKKTQTIDCKPPIKHQQNITNIIEGENAEYYIVNGTYGGQSKQIEQGTA